MLQAFQYTTYSFSSPEKISDFCYMFVAAASSTSMDSSVPISDVNGPSQVQEWLKQSILLVGHNASAKYANTGSPVATHFWPQ
jgi:hypothetical protein